MSRVLGVITLSVALAGAGACERSPRGPKHPAGETDTNFDNYLPLASAVASADKVVLYEGLPHQKYEQKVLQEELDTKQTVQHHGFPFYAEPLPLKDADAKQLTALFTDARSFAPWPGSYKACGGFHPDYCIEWHVGQEVVRCLVCFGCHEVKAFGPATELYCDVNNEAYAQFEKVLRPYRKNRPMKKQ